MSPKGDAGALKATSHWITPKRRIPGKSVGCLCMILMSVEFLVRAHAVVAASTSPNQSEQW